MYAATISVALVGGDVRPVEVQVHVGRQHDQFKLSGLPAPQCGRPKTGFGRR
jgi:hypothetical protein